MKALFISNDPTIFDPTSVARTRMHAYAKAIGELHIVSPAGKGVREQQEEGLFLHPVHAPKLFRVSALARRARKIIRTEGIEVVSAQDPFEQGLAALRATRGTGAKLHVQVHTDFLSPWFVKSDSWRLSSLRMAFLNRHRRKIAGRVLPAADGIRVVSERVKASLMVRYGSRPSETDAKSHRAGIPEPSVIPILVDATTCAPLPLPVHSFKFALIAVGRLEAEKRVGDILVALKLVLVHYPMVGLFIVGEGSERARLEHQVHALGLDGKVIFLGNRPDAHTLMPSAHAFIQASAYEGYGRTLIEAALAKVPIITTDVGIVGDVLKNEEDVLAVPVNDPMALSRSVAKLIEDLGVRQMLPLHAEAAARTHLASVGDLGARIADDLARLVR